ncbi:universal stress protein [Actinoplanes friuliensis]|uniref:universal stress protein n=1 Tax=Actinoplanes friuliensis TaxID=196914 RepID=UPI00041E3BDF|nr:universal stress protein [Actinoplanes friuliensis]
MSRFELGTDGPGAIIVGVDGSETSLRAAAYAAGLARRQHTRVIVVYARSASSLLTLADHTGLATRAAVETHDAIEEQLRTELAKQARIWGVDASLEVRRGDPLTVLTEVARDVRADAVIVGSSQSRGHRIAGSLAVRLVRCGRWPVTVVP